MLEAPRTITYPYIDSLGLVTGALGQGSYGVVVKWRSDRTGIEYAVKQFRPSKGGSITADAIREISILRALKHPNIIEILDVGDFSLTGRESLSMILPLGIGEFGMFTRQIGEIRAFEYPKYKKMAYQLCSALGYMHDRGVIHRDLKSNNIIVLPGDIPAIADFGASRFGAIPGGSYTSGLQTKWWRAPEMFLSEDTLENYDSKIDVFSMGVILMELFCSVSPIFGASTNSEILQLQISVLGHFHETDFPGISRMPAFLIDPSLVAFASRPDRLNGKIEQKVFQFYKSSNSAMPQNLKDIIIGMTYPNPKVRISMREVLSNPFWDDIRDRQTLIPAPICGSGYVALRENVLNQPIRGETILLQRHLLHVGWSFCTYYRLDVTAKMYYRFIYEQFRRTYTNLFRSGDPLVEEMEPLSIENLGLVMVACAHIAALLYHKIEFKMKMRSIFNYVVRNNLFVPDLSIERVKKMVKSIIKVLRFDVAYNTYVEYNDALLAKQNLSRDVVNASNVIAKLFYIMEVERALDSEKLARISLELACRGYHIPNPQCLVDSPFSAGDIEYYTQQMFKLVAVLDTPEYGEFQSLKKSVAEDPFRHVLVNILNVQPVSAVRTIQPPKEVLNDYAMTFTLEIDGFIDTDGSLLSPGNPKFQSTLLQTSMDTISTFGVVLIHRYAAGILEVVENAAPTEAVLIFDIATYFKLKKVPGPKIAYKWNETFTQNIDVSVDRIGRSIPVKVFILNANYNISRLLTVLQNKINSGSYAAQIVEHIVGRFTAP